MSSHAGGHLLSATLRPSFPCLPQIFGCSPDQLGPGIRAELEAVLRESAGLIEASIRWVPMPMLSAGLDVGCCRR